VTRVRIQKSARRRRLDSGLPSTGQADQQSRLTQVDRATALIDDIDRLLVR
jgi:hypothetical protein